MSDQNILAFVKFIFYRFVGYTPEDKMLQNALEDFKKEMGK